MNLGACPSWPLFHLAKAAADRVKGIAANGPRPRNSSLELTRSGTYVLYVYARLPRRQAQHRNESGSDGEGQVGIC